MKNQPEQTNVVAHVVKKYRPSNDTEGAAFMDAWCCNCAKDKFMTGEKEYDECAPDDLCPIIANTHTFEVDDPEYPAEWQYGEKGVPCCTAYALTDDAQPPCEHTADMFGGGAT